MTREVKVVIKCDECDEPLTDVEVEEFCFSISLSGGPVKQIDLCRAHAMAASLHALRLMYRDAPLAGPAESDPLACPDCDFVAKSKSGLGKHRAAQHKP